MKPQDIKNMSDEQITGAIADLSKKHMDLRFEQATGQLKQASEMRKARRDVARLMTEQNARLRAPKKPAEDAAHAS